MIFKHSLNILIFSILLIAIDNAMDLSIIDYQRKNICPKFLGIPACYWVVGFFTVGLIGHIFQKYRIAQNIFYSAIGLTFLLAFNGTLTELSGTVVCPRTAGGIPMCFISLGICSSLLLLKFLLVKYESRITSNEID